MVTWNANVDALLFKHILKLHEIKPNYEKLCKAMREEGIDVTPKAITHRFAKLRQSVNEEKDADSPPLPAKPTIKARKTMSAGKKRDFDGKVKIEKETPKKVRMDGDAFKSSPLPTNGDSDEEEDVTPVPKKRKLVKKAPAKKAVESEDEEDDGDAI